MFWFAFLPVVELFFAVCSGGTLGRVRFGSTSKCRIRTATCSVNQDREDHAEDISFIQSNKNIVRRGRKISNFKADWPSLSMLDVRTIFPGAKCSIRRRKKKSYL